MKLGVIARAEDRGLGNMSRDFVRHMNPERVLVVIPSGVRHAHLRSHLDWYPGATVVDFDGELPESVCREWLQGLDAVWVAETFYDWRLCRWARAANVATVCHVMPEWMHRQWAEEPTAWWAPTSWMMSRLPAGTRHVPVPIATERFGGITRPDSPPFRWLHVGGAPTHFDRNGTEALRQAAVHLRAEQVIVRQSQATGGGVTNYWDLYRDVDALVLPRRYAGLCLPVLEAFGAGLPVLMTDMAPQNVDWPVCTVKTEPGPIVRMMGGRIPTGDADPVALAELMDMWATTPTVVDEWRVKARQYAADNAWEVRAPEIRAELELVADRVAA